MIGGFGARIGDEDPEAGNLIGNNASPGVVVDTSSRVIIQGNTLGGVGQGNESGIVVSGKFGSTSILQNTIRLNRSSGIIIEDADGTKIHGNIITENRRYGMT